VLIEVEFIPRYGGFLEWGIPKTMDFKSILDDLRVIIPLQESCRYFPPYSAPSPATPAAGHLSVVTPRHLACRRDNHWDEGG